MIQHYNQKCDNCKIFITEDKIELSNYLLVSAELHYGLTTVEMCKFGYQFASNITERPERSLPITSTASQMNSPPNMNVKEQICNSLSGEPVAYNTPEENGDSPFASISSHHRQTP